MRESMIAQSRAMDCLAKVEAGQRYECPDHDRAADLVFDQAMFAALQCSRRFYVLGIAMFSALMCSREGDDAAIVGARQQARRFGWTGWQAR